MTIPVSQRRAGPYPGTGSQTAFDFGFKVFDETDLRVVMLDVPTNVETESVLNSDYTVSINPDQESTPGGTVNYLVAPAATKKVTIVGDLSYEQPTDLPDGGAYRAQQVENGLDRLSILIQQLKEITDRCAQVPVSSTDAEALFESINILAANLATLQTLVTNIADLITLANEIGDVNAVAAISVQIQTVAAIAAQVMTVALIASEVVTVDSIAADVQTVAANMSAILAAVADLPALAGKANSGDVSTSLLTTGAATIVGRVAGAGTGALQQLTPEQVVALVRSSTGQAQAGLDNDTLLSPLRLKEAQIMQSASVSLSGQSTVDFTGIPPWAKRIVVAFNGVSTTGASIPHFQLGDAGGIETTGYAGTTYFVANASTGTVNPTAGIPLITAWLATNVAHGTLVLTKMAGNLWVGIVQCGRSETAVFSGSAVSKTLSDVLTQVRLLAGGADTFDAGTAVISWE